MTEPLIRYPFIKDNDKKVPTDLQNKLIRDLIDVGWMSDKGLKWFGWDVNGWYAWTDANGMIYRIRDLKRNEDGKRFEKEVTKIIRVDEPRNDIRASANELYQHEFNLCVDCQLCPDRSGVSDSDTDTNTSTDAGGGEKEEEINVTAPPWQSFTGGGITDYAAIHGGNGTGYDGGSPNYGGQGDSFTDYTPPTATPTQTVYTGDVTDTSTATGNGNPPAIKGGGKTTAAPDVIESPAAPPPKQLIPGKSKNKGGGGFSWDGNHNPPTKIPVSVGTYGVVPTYQPPTKNTGIPNTPKQFPPFETPKFPRPPITNIKNKPDCKDLIDAANMAQDVYNDGKSKLSGGWKKSNKEIDGFKREYDDFGFSSELYERKSIDGSMEYAYVYRGSDDYKDWIQNFTQNLGISPQHIIAVKNANILNRLFKDKVKFIGHSLGGGLASLAALVTGNSAITFNAAGLSNSTHLLYGTLFDNSKHITSVILKGELLSMMSLIVGVNSAIGKTINLKGNVSALPVSIMKNGILSALLMESYNRHDIAEVISALKANCKD